MNLESLGNLGDFIGGVAVVATLLYLAVQVRSNTRESRNAVVQGILGTSASANLEIATGPLAELFDKVARGEALSEGEQARWEFFLYGAFSQYWQVFYHHRHSGIDPQVFAAFENRIRSHLERDITLDWWRRAEGNFARDFRAWVNSKIPA